MNKRALIVLTAFAALFALAVPYWAISKEGGADASPEKVAEADKDAKRLFAINCGSCHILERAGTDGIVGPNLDDLLGDGTPEGNESRVLNAIENGIQGRMPAGILRDEQAREVSEFVARVAGE